MNRTLYICLVLFYLQGVLLIDRFSLPALLGVYIIFICAYLLTSQRKSIIGFVMVFEILMVLHIYYFIIMRKEVLSCIESILSISGCIIVLAGILLHNTAIMKTGVVFVVLSGAIQLAVAGKNLISLMPYYNIKAFAPFRIVKNLISIAVEIFPAIVLKTHYCLNTSLDL